MPGRIDDDKAVMFRQRIDGVRESRAAFALAAARGVGTQMLWDIELASDALTPSAPVVDVMGQTSLPGIEIDGGYRLARLHERNSNVHRDRRFTRPTLFIADHDHAGRPRRFFHRHERPQTGLRVQMKDAAWRRQERL